MSSPALDILEEKLGYKFKNRDYLEKALTHSSTGKNINYERLEFLGDRVLGLIMAHRLFEIFPKENEGGLAKRHAALVQGKTLAVIAADNDLGDFIFLSDSEREAGGADNENILSDVLEALLGAIYLDGGLEAAQAVIKTLWGDNIKTLTKAPQDPKTELQEWAQARSLGLPNYKILDKSGPDHAPVFDIEVSVTGFDPVSATGNSRRLAEKEAATQLLKKLKAK